MKKTKITVRVKLPFTWILTILAVCAIILTLLWSGVPSRRGLVVNTFGGKVLVNTHAQQPMELNPWQQPRLSIQMEWFELNKDAVKVTLFFISMAKKGKLCAGLVTVNGFGAHLGLAEYENRIMKNGIWETVYVPISIDILNQLASVKMPLKFKVCGVEFFPHKYEAEDLRQAAEIWKGWQ